MVVHGEGIYFEKESWEAPAKPTPIRKGSVTAIQGDGFHAVENSGDEPLIIFVITTNEPQ